MQFKWVFNHFPVSPRRHIRLLALLWVVGLLAGILLYCICSDDSTGMLQSIMAASPAPLCLLLVCVLPVTATAISLSTQLFALSYPTVFLNAFCHGFTGIVISAGQGSGAWLLRPMILFSASCTSVLMWWLFLRSGDRNRLMKDIRLAYFLSCFVFAIDLFIISPLLGDLSKYF